MPNIEFGRVVHEKEVMKGKLDEKLMEQGREKGDKGRRNRLLAKK